MEYKPRYTKSIATGAFVCLAPLYLVGALWPQFDQQILDRILAIRTPDMTELMWQLTQFGAFYIIAPTTILLALGVAWFDRRIAGFIALAAATSALAVQAIKHLVARPRPGELWAVYDAGGYSFPSGHAAAALTFALTLTLALNYLKPSLSRSAMGKAALLLPITVAIAIGLTRPYLGVHFPTDVVAGWALAIAMVAGLEIVLLRNISHRQAGAEATSRTDQD